MIAKVCKESGCSNLALEGKSYCKEHYKERKPFEGAKRNNEGLYSTWTWQNLRREHLKQEPFCVWCGATTDLSVDHITPPEGNGLLFFNEGNLQTLCRSCHRKKTAMEIEARKNRK